MQTQTYSEMSDCVDHGRKGGKKGYHSGTTIKVDGVSVRKGMHVAVFYQTHGFFPPIVRHTCNNSRCVNPEHLVAGTYTDNNRDTVASGKHARLKFSQDVVDKIRANYVSGCKVYGNKALAKLYGMTSGNVSSIVSGRTRKAHSPTL